MSGKTQRNANRAAQSLRLAAAHKLARLIYTMLTKGEEYVDQGQKYYEEATGHACFTNWSNARGGSE